MDIRDEAFVETPVRRSNLHRVKISCVISCLLGEDVEFGEICFCGHFALCEAIESEGGIGLEGRREEDSVRKRPEQGDGERRSSSPSVEDFVNDGLNPTLSFSDFHVRRDEEDFVFVGTDAGLVCVEEDSDLSFPYLILRFGSVIVIGTSNQTLVVGGVVHRSCSTGKGHERKGLDFGMLMTTRVVRTRSLRPRPDGGGILFEKDLVLVGELCGVEDSYSSEKDVAAEGVCVETSVVFDSSKAKAETTEIVG